MNNIAKMNLIINELFFESFKLSDEQQLFIERKPSLLVDQLNNLSLSKLISCTTNILYIKDDILQHKMKDILFNICLDRININPQCSLLRNLTNLYTIDYTDHIIHFLLKKPSLRNKSISLFLNMINIHTLSDSQKELVIKAIQPYKDTIIGYSFLKKLNNTPLISFFEKNISDCADSFNKNKIDYYLYLIDYFILDKETAIHFIQEYPNVNFDSVKYWFVVGKILEEYPDLNAMCYEFIFSKALFNHKPRGIRLNKLSMSSDLLRSNLMPVLLDRNKIDLQIPSYKDIIFSVNDPEIKANTVFSLMAVFGPQCISAQLMHIYPMHMDQIMNLIHIFDINRDNINQYHDVLKNAFLKKEMMLDQTLIME